MSATDKKSRLRVNRSAGQETQKADFRAAFTRVETEELKRLTLNITPERHRKLKGLAAQQGVSMTDLVNNFIDSL